MAKSAATSKTIIVNVLSLIAGILTLFTPEFFFGVGVGEHQQLIALGVIGAINGTLNLVLRLLTNQPVDAGAISSIIQGIAGLFAKKK